MGSMGYREKGFFSLPVPEGAVVGCTIGLKFFLFLLPCSLAVPSHTNFVLGHVTCFVQGDFSKEEASEGLKNAGALELAHLLYL